jgi:hypothetical protein
LCEEELQLARRRGFWGQAQGFLEHNNSMRPFIGLDSANYFHLREIDDSDSAIRRSVHNGTLCISRDRHVEREMSDFHFCPGLQSGHIKFLHEARLVEHLFAVSRA